MKNLKIIICFLLFLPTISFAESGLSPFLRDLKIGMIGEDVRQLQKILNKDPDTRVAQSGIGSLGQESMYFGLLTQKAVINFQEKYQDAILKPYNLSKGTGFVGKSTRNLLSSFFTSNYSIESANNITLVISSTIPKQNSVDDKPIKQDQKTINTISENNTTSENASKNNSNYQNIGIFLDSIDRIATKNGFSKEKIALIKEEIYKGISTTTDLKSQFLSIMQKRNQEKKANNQVSFGLFGTIVNKLESIFISKDVLAGTGIPFGGALLVAFPCTCSNTWLLTITPLPPTGVTLLDYIEGSQAFLSFNIPFTSWLLGEYILGANTCFTGYMCTGIPAEGLITPVVGSSL